MDPRIRSGTARPARAMPAESQASQRVRHVAKAPANPFLFVYECNPTVVIRYLLGTCQANQTLGRNKIPARDRHPAGLLDRTCQTERVRPQRNTRHIPSIPRSFLHGHKCKSSTLSTGSAISTRSFRWRVSGRHTEPACACQILTRCQRH